MQDQNSTSNLQLATLRSRALAFVIDDLIVTLLICLIYWNSIVAVSDNQEALINLMQTTFVVPLILLKKLEIELICLVLKYLLMVKNLEQILHIKL